MRKDYKLNTINILDILFIVFLYLKLTNQITWSWWYVCSPLIVSYIGYTLVCLISLANKNKNN